MHALLTDFCVCLFVAQDVGTVCRTAAGTSPPLVSPMDTQPTCTASGEYQSHPEKRYGMSGKLKINFATP